MIKQKSLATTLLASAMCLALAQGAALAGNGNGNGGTRGNSGAHSNSGQNGTVASQNGSANGKSGNAQNGKGKFGSEFSKIASELKWMNSAHASQTAREHAALNSRPGKDGTYLQAALDTQDAYDDLYDADPTLAENADGISLEDAKAMYESETDPDAKANDEKLVNYLSAQEAEAEALDSASGGRTLSDTALNAYRGLLGL